ncbi:MAG TPA: endolytic transglycosylase MltG, partial [bacterium]|nr:endolytic transglycosylase MltG [bacterium]
VKFARASSQLRAGELRFHRDLTPAQVLETLLHAPRVLHKMTVPEGLTAKEIAKIVGDSGLGNAEEFLRLTEDAEFAKSVGVSAPRLEGYLFPDTYEFEKGAGAKLIATTMVKHFQAVWTPELAAKAKALGMDTTAKAVTLASIVEKETGAAEERPMIAGVFYNRLRKGMRLESDPTIIYGMKDYDGNIRKGDIHDPSNVYNTYVIKGLPPGPIANPGAESLKAIADPKMHDYLFFVATGEGRHVFAATLKEHEANVDRYQRHRVSAKKG